MEVAERDEAGKAVRFNFDFPSGNLQNLIKFISSETNLTIIASENDIKEKKFALTNLKNVTIEETLEEIKTVLAQYDLTMIRTNNTLLITTFEKAVRMKVPVKRVTADANLIEQTDEIQTYIIQLNNATASELVNGIKPLLSKAANIFADTNSNALVITDVASNIHRIATILQVADEAPEAALKVEIVPLSNATARSLAQTLSEVFREEGQVTNLLRKMSGAKNPEDMQKMMERAKKEGGSIDMLRGRIQIAADESSNSLIIKASESNLVVLKGLIQQLDTAPSIQTEMKIFRLNYAIAQDVAQTLEELITGQSAGRRPGRNAERWERREWDRRRRDLQRNKGEGGEYQGIIGTVNISSNDRLNAVLISADPRNFPIIQKIIEELDQADPQEEIRIYFLKFAAAQTLKDNLQDLFEGSNSGRDRDLPWWARRREDRSGGGSEGGFGVQGDVHLVAETRLNAILASTAAQNFETIDSLIKRLDVNMPDQEWGTRIYKLKYADAENVADIINNVYQGGNNSSGGFFFFVPGRARNQNQGSLAGNVSAEPYPTLNAVIVSTATQRNFELITQFIQEIDSPTPDEQREVTKSFRLEYADAEEMEDLLEDVWGEGESGGGGFSFSRFFARGGRLEQKDINSLRGKVQVEADNQTNTLVITAAQRYMSDVEAMIRELDFVRGQVWIDIQILEITLDESTKLGVGLTLREKNLFGAEVRDGNPLIGEFNSQLGLEQEISGFTLSLATKEYLAFLHTLIRENKVQTISTPALLTRDNRQATWTSGRRIPFLQSVDTSSLLSGNITQPLFNYDFIEPPVGVNITITPHIAKSQAGPGGKRTIGLDIEQISLSNFVEFTDFNAPITDDSSISAYIDVGDGQQIVVGGMIKEKRQRIESKVPILGDIPLLGRLFKKTETATENSEVVIIITPHIIDLRNPMDRGRLQEKANAWRSNGNNGTMEQDEKTKEK
ncbi:MAG: hypothetical protein O7E52_12225 [Candidatus Poribacteria bacterium]|nr:hypothetical protein [Candidatus Poribacteria bacterium]